MYWQRAQRFITYWTCIIRLECKERMSSCIKTNQMTYIYCTFLTEFNRLIPSQITGKRIPRPSRYDHRHHLMVETIVHIWSNNDRLQCLGTLLDRKLITYPADCWNTSLILNAKVRCDNDSHEYIRIKNPYPRIVRLAEESILLSQKWVILLITLLEIIDWAQLDSIDLIENVWKTHLKAINLIVSNHVSQYKSINLIVFNCVFLSFSNGSIVSNRLFLEGRELSRSYLITLTYCACVTFENCSQERF